MKLFNKKNEEDLNNQNQIILKEIEEIKEIISNEAKRDFTYDLLEEKSMLEKNLAKEITKKEQSEQNYRILEEKVIEITKTYDSQLISYQKEIVEWKTKATQASNSIGGLRRQNNSLSRRLEQQVIYVQLLSKELKKYIRKVPTLKQLLDYEHTRKSPFKSEKNRKGELKNESNQCKTNY